MLLDIAREVRGKGNKVLVIFVGQLNNYMFLSEQLEFKIIPISKLRSLNFEEENFDTILIDEGQRLNNDQYEYLMSLPSRVIISVDHAQTLHPSEDQRNIENKVVTSDGIQVIHLEKKVRTDKEMADFISRIMNLSARNVLPHDFNKVEIAYFDTKEMVEKFIESKVLYENYTSIEFTEYITRNSFKTKKPRISIHSLSAHEVVGKEYDNVIAVIDKNFYRAADRKLSYNSSAEWYPYTEMSLFFQALTRVRKKIIVVIVQNPRIYLDIQQNLLSWKKDQLSLLKAYDQERNYDTWEDAINCLEIKIKSRTYSASKVEYNEKNGKVRVSYYLN